MGIRSVRKSFVGVFVVVLSMGACRGAYVNLWVVGSGQTLTSPSMRYTASAMSFEGKRFFGGTQRWSRLHVTDGLGRVIWETKVYSDLDVEWRADGTVLWSADSSEVTFTAAQSNGARMKLHSATFPSGPSVDEVVDDLKQHQPQ